MEIRVHDRTMLIGKTRGLIGRRIIKPIYFKTRFGIHTFGMKQNIDVLILSSESIVVSQKKFLKPNRIFLWNPLYFRIVELPGGFINNNKIKIGDRAKLVLI